MNQITEQSRNPLSEQALTIADMYQFQKVVVIHKNLPPELDEYFQILDDAHENADGKLVVDVTDSLGEWQTLYLSDMGIIPYNVDTPNACWNRFNFTVLESSYAAVNANPVRESRPSALRCPALQRIS